MSKPQREYESDIDGEDANGVSGSGGTGVLVVKAEELDEGGAGA